MKLAKLLASSFPEKRAKGISKLCKYICREKEFTEKEMFQIWHAIYHCYWLSDTEEEQDQISEALGGLLMNMPTEKRIWLYIEGFWFTMKKNWVKIDIRMNKYMWLVRQFCFYTLKYVQENKWKTEFILKWCSALEKYPLDGDKSSRGVCNHVCDIFLEELNKAVEDEAFSFDTFCSLLQPFFKLQTVHTDTYLASRCKEKVFEAITEQATSEEDNLNLMGMLPKLSAHIFEEAKKADMMDLGRRRLYRIKDQIDKTLALLKESAKKRPLEEDSRPKKKMKVSSD